MLCEVNDVPSDVLQVCADFWRFQYRHREEVKEDEDIEEFFIPPHLAVDVFFVSKKLVCTHKDIRDGRAKAQSMAVASQHAEDVAEARDRQATVKANAARHGWSAEDARGRLPGGPRKK